MKFCRSAIELMTVGLLMVSGSFAQDSTGTIDVSSMSKEQLQKLTNKELVNLPLEDLLLVSEKLGVSVDELLNMKVGVSSKKALSPRESPGIVSVISGEDIVNSGARDIIDVLRLVPGFEFGYDVEGVTSVGIRGIWAHEGKVLLLIDGQEMNDLLFSGVQLGRHFNVESIQRIEILRGPGSCVYGGFAELGVMNIITKKSDDINGISMNAGYGQMLHDPGHVKGGLQVGKFFPNFDFSISGFGSLANRSDRPYTDNYDAVYGTETDIMKLGAANANVNLNVKDLKTRFIFDFYRTNRVYDDEAYAGSLYADDFITFLGEAKYDLRAGDRWTITPRANVKQQATWKCDDPDPDLYYNVWVGRYTGNVTALCDINEKLNFLVGAEGYYDRATDDSMAFTNGENAIGYYNISGFAQGLLKTRFLNVVLGGRIDWHSEYGAAYSPRVGLTGLLRNFHYKAIFSRSFRSPGIENIRWNIAEDGVIDPENTTVFEIELGYRLTENMFITANLFDMTIREPIVYSYNDSTGDDEYDNYGRTGSSGAEVEYRFKYNWGQASVSYSYYNSGALDRNDVESYMAPDDESVMLGFPQHKVTLNSSFNIGKFILSPSATFLSQRYAITGYDENDEAVYEAQDPVFLLNLFARYKNLFVEGLSVGAGVYNIFNQQYDFIQPYDVGNPPMPGPGVEFLAKLTYDLKF